MKPINTFYQSDGQYYQQEALDRYLSLTENLYSQNRELRKSATPKLNLNCNQNFIRVNKNDYMMPQMSDYQTTMRERKFNMKIHQQPKVRNANYNQYLKDNEKKEQQRRSQHTQPNPSFAHIFQQAQVPIEQFMNKNKIIHQNFSDIKEEYKNKTEISNNSKKSLTKIHLNLAKSESFGDYKSKNALQINKLSQPNALLKNVSEGKNFIDPLIQPIEKDEQQINQLNQLNSQIKRLEIQVSKSQQGYELNKILLENEKQKNHQLKKKLKKQEKMSSPQNESDYLYNTHNSKSSVLNIDNVKLDKFRDFQKSHISIIDKKNDTNEEQLLQTFDQMKVDENQGLKEQIKLLQETNQQLQENYNILSDQMIEKEKFHQKNIQNIASNSLGKDSRLESCQNRFIDSQKKTQELSSSLSKQKIQNLKLKIQLEQYSENINKNGSKVNSLERKNELLKKKYQKEIQLLQNEIKTYQLKNTQEQQKHVKLDLQFQEKIQQIIQLEQQLKENNEQKLIQHNKEKEYQNTQKLQDLQKSYQQQINNITNKEKEKYNLLDDLLQQQVNKINNFENQLIEQSQKNNIKYDQLYSKNIQNIQTIEQQKGQIEKFKNDQDLLQKQFLKVQQQEKQIGDLQNNLQQQQHKNEEQYKILQNEYDILKGMKNIDSYQENISEIQQQNNQLKEKNIELNDLITYSNNQVQIFKEKYFQLNQNHLKTQEQQAELLKQNQNLQDKLLTQNDIQQTKFKDLINISKISKSKSYISIHKNSISENNLTLSIQKQIEYNPNQIKQIQQLQENEFFQILMGDIIHQHEEEIELLEKQNNFLQNELDNMYTSVEESQGSKQQINSFDKQFKKQSIVIKKNEIEIMDKDKKVLSKQIFELEFQLEQKISRIKYQESDYNLVKNQLNNEKFKVEKLESELFFLKGEILENNVKQNVNKKIEETSSNCYTNQDRENIENYVDHSEIQKYILQEALNLPLILVQQKIKDILTKNFDKFYRNEYVQKKLPQLLEDLFNSFIESFRQIDISYNEVQIQMGTQRDQLQQIYFSKTAKDNFLDISGIVEVNQALQFMIDDVYTGVPINFEKSILEEADEEVKHLNQCLEYYIEIIIRQQREITFFKKSRPKDDSQDEIIEQINEYQEQIKEYEINEIKYQNQIKTLRQEKEELKLHSEGYNQIQSLKAIFIQFVINNFQEKDIPTEVLRIVCSILQFSYVEQDKIIEFYKHYWQVSKKKKINLDILISQTK